MKEFKFNLVQLVLIVFAIIVMTTLVVIEIMKYCSIESKTIKDDNTNYSSSTTINETNDNDEIPEASTVIGVKTAKGKEIYSFLTKVWTIPEIYSDNMPEFDNIKETPKDYLAACAYTNVDKSGQGDDIYNYHIPLKNFNDALIKVFGPDADGLIKDSDFNGKFYLGRNADGTYFFNGFDGSEVSGSDFIIESIEKNGEKYEVTLLEYKYKNDNMVIGLGNGEKTNSKYYDKQGNLFLTLTIIGKQEGNSFTTYTYDEKGNKVDAYGVYDFIDGYEICGYENKYITENYKDKLSVRKVELIYNEDTNSYNLLNSKFVKNTLKNDEKE